MNYYSKFNHSGSSLSLALTEVSRTHNGPIFVIAENSQSAGQLALELDFFQKDIENKLPLFSFPDWETLPYDHFSPHQDIISQRLITLYKLPSLIKGIVITNINTLMQKIAPKRFTQEHTFFIEVGETLNITDFRRQLEYNGYHIVSQVYQHGECAIRGSIIDIYPMGSQRPYRIDLFDNDIESIHYFDLESQLSTEKVKRIALLPANEFPLDESAITQFRQAWRQQFSSNTNLSPLYDDVSHGIAPAGIEYYLPLFFQQTDSLFDYLPENSLVVRLGELNTLSEQFWREINQRYEQRNADITRPILQPQLLYYRPDELFLRIKAFQQLKQTTETSVLQTTSNQTPDLTIDRKANPPLYKLADYLKNNTRRVLICAESAGRREIINTLLQATGVQANPVNNWHDFINSDSLIAITYGPLATGIILTDENIEVIVESQLFDQHIVQQRRSKQQAVNPDVIIKSLSELREGTPVVHLELGVGRYQGLQILPINDIPCEFLTLSYAGGDKVYVPVNSLHLISRYTGSDTEHAPLHKLGQDQWRKIKEKATKKIRDVASELLDIYAQREARKGFQYQPPDQHYQAFCQAFPFEETDDQKRAFEEIIKDMGSTRPLDRLICGDVGFGKTEVAMRAAFLAVNDHKQVVILVPTTLLATQHFQNFNDRFADFPINIALLSRFVTAKEQAIAIEQLKQGKVDIIIGTHKLLQKNITYHNLGMVIIDEEHRFGVRQKEFLKQLRSEVDILSLTATPIPRTLNMSMAGMRDISIIATPPAKRLSIKTFYHQKNDSMIREAILREVMRGGQVFFVHNKVDTIQATQAKLAELVPEAKIEFAHGQMPERQLEQIMSNFYHLRFNVLVCTTIVENGIDIPTANTIIIDRADRFGLAQLHQLRGRVGRSYHQAYAYLITPAKEAMTKDAIKRLEAISSLEDLGVGFTLATHDLEIRGAGELLGDEQSGHIHEIGFTLYMELLDRAVKALKSGKQPELDKALHAGPEIDLQVNITIPENYLPDVHQRLILYKRIANAENQEQLEGLQVEIIDRFGLLPESMKHLFLVTELKLHAEKLGIKKIVAHNKGGYLQFDNKPKVNPEKIIQLMRTQPSHYRLDGPEKLQVKLVSQPNIERINLFAELCLAIA